MTGWLKLKLFKWRTGKGLFSSLPASYPFYVKYQEVRLCLPHGYPQAVNIYAPAFPMSWHACMAPQWSLAGVGWYYMHKASHIVLNNSSFIHTAFMTGAFYVSDSCWNAQHYNSTPRTVHLRFCIVGGCISFQCDGSESSQTKKPSFETPCGPTTILSSSRLPLPSSFALRVFCTTLLLYSELAHMRSRAPIDRIKLRWHAPKPPTMHNHISTWKCIRYTQDFRICFKDQRMLKLVWRFSVQTLNRE